MPVIKSEGSPHAQGAFKKSGMSGSLKSFLQRWLINTVAVMVAAKIVPGIECDSITGLFTASLLLGIFNALLLPHEMEAAFQSIYCQAAYQRV